MSSLVSSPAQRSVRLASAARLARRVAAARLRCSAPSLSPVSRPCIGSGALGQQLEHLACTPGAAGRGRPVPPRSAGRRDGRLLPPAQRVRRDGGLRAVVLRPVDEHLPGAQHLRHPGHHQVRHVLLDGLGDLPRAGGRLVGGQRAVEPGVQVNALGPAGDRDERAARHPLPDRPGHLARIRPVRHPGPGSRSNTSRSGRTSPKAVVLALGSVTDSVGTERPLRHMQFQGGDLAQPGQRRRRIDDRVGLRPVRMLDRPPRSPSDGVPLGRSLWKNGVVVTPSGQRLRVTGRSARCGIIACATSAK